MQIMDWTVTQISSRFKRYLPKQTQKKIFRGTDSSFLETGKKTVDMGADMGEVDVPLSEKCNKNLKLSRRVRRQS